MTIKSLTFTTQIKNNSITLPENQKNELEGKEVKVVVMLNEEHIKNETADTFNLLTQNQFLSGYADEDAIYDNY